MSERREDADGTPHLSYFAEGISFVWSGSAERPIQVCPGGAGEPVRYEFWPDFVGGGAPIPGHQLIRLFQLACDSWIDDRFGPVE